MGQPQGLHSASEMSSYAEATHLLKKHKWSEAILAFRSILSTEPDSVRCRVGLGKALTHSGKREEALNGMIQLVAHLKGAQKNLLIRRIHVFSRVCLSNKTFQIYQEGVNFLLAQKYRMAQEKFEKALSEESGNVEILTRLGQSLILSGDFTGAVNRLVSAKKLNPFEPEVRLWLGKALVQGGRPLEGLQEFQSAYQEMPESEQAAVWLAEALAGSGQGNSALKVLSNDTKKWPFHVTSLFTLAKLRIQQGHLDSQSLGLVRKDLKMALDRLEHSPQDERSPEKIEISLDLRRPLPELKEEIQKLLNQAYRKYPER